MSAVLPKIDGFVGYGDGAEALLRSDEPWDSEHQLVKERPELFDIPAETPPVDAPPDETLAEVPAPVDPLSDESSAEIPAPVGVPPAKKAAPAKKVPAKKAAAGG